VSAQGPLDRQSHGAACALPHSPLLFLHYRQSPRAIAAVAHDRSRYVLSAVPGPSPIRVRPQSRVETIWLLHQGGHRAPSLRTSPSARNHAAEAERPPAVKVPVLQMTVAAPSASRVDQAVHAAPAAPLHLSSFSLGKKSLESSNWNENTAADPNRWNLAASGRLVGQVTADTEQPRRFRGGDGECCAVLHARNGSALS
jgi:hypothetical protein